MNFKYRITNNTAVNKGGANKRNLFMTVAGKAIKPGEICYALRIDQATKNLADARDILVEEGNFAIGNDLSKKAKPNVVVNLDDDDAPPSTFKPPVVHSPDEPLSPRDEGPPRVTVSTTGTSPPPVIKTPGEPMRGRWEGTPRATPPAPLKPEDMPERIVMPPREGTEKVATAPASANPDKGGVKALGGNFDPDDDVPNFGGDAPDAATAASPSAPTSPGKGKKSKT